MSKLAKICAVFIPIGIVTSIAGGIIMASSDEPDFDISSSEESYETSVADYEDDYDDDDDLSVICNSNEADSIVLNCNTSTVDIHRSEKYTVNSDELEENKLSVSNSDRTINITYGVEENTDFDNDKISVGIPRSCKSVTVKCSTGDITIEGFMGNTMNISVDCGNVEIKNSTVSDSCVINNTLGNAYFYGCDINSLNADMVSGNISIYSTMLSGSNKLNIDVGNAYLTFKGYPSDYTINAKVKVGEIDCDYDLSENTYSDDIIDISILAGDCSIDFYDE